MPRQYGHGNTCAAVQGGAGNVQCRGAEQRREGWRNTAFKAPRPQGLIRFQKYLCHCAEMLFSYMPKAFPDALHFRLRCAAVCRDLPATTTRTFSGLLETSCGGQVPRKLSHHHGFHHPSRRTLQSVAALDEAPISCPHVSLHSGPCKVICLWFASFLFAGVLVPRRYLSVISLIKGARKRFRNKAWSRHRSPPAPK